MNGTDRRDYGYYDDLSRTSVPTRRAGNIDVYTVSDAENVSEVGVCALHGFLMFTTPGSYLFPTEINSAGAAALAAHHFNNGDGSVVPDLAGVNERCAVRFALNFANTEGSESQAVGMLADVVGGQASCKGDGEDRRRLPCAVLGATRSASAEPMSMMSAWHDLPQMSWTAGSSDLSDRTVHPLFSRVIGSTDALARASQRYLQVECKCDHVAVLFINDTLGNPYVQLFQTLAQESGMKTTAVPYPPSPTDAERMEAVTALKDTGYRCIFAITVITQFDELMEEAYRQGITGDEYLWIVGNDAGFNTRSVEAGLELDQASHGVGFITMKGGREGIRGYDKFSSAWQTALEDDSEGGAASYIKSLIPKDIGFTDQVFDDYALYAYDTIAAMGLAACAVTNGSDFFNGPELYGGITESSFEGSSGLVMIDKETGTRKSTSMRMEVLNMQRTGVDEEGKSKFELILSGAFQPNKNGSDWEFVQGEPFRYADNTTIAPPSLPPVNGGKGVNENYVGNLRYTGYALFGIIAFLSLSFSTWTVYNRKTRVVRGSQPTFLLLVCLGVTVMASAIITTSLDHEHFTQAKCDIACMATPWLVSTGFVICFSALFSKTWRINLILNNPNKFKKVKVDVKDVMGPLVLFMTANLTVLISWTVLSPVQFVRLVNKTGTDQFNRPITASWNCAADPKGAEMPYVITLVALNSLLVVFANYQAYRARNISTDYSESGYIAMCMVSIFQALVICIPVLLLQQGQTAAHRNKFTTVTIILCIVSGAILLLMFVPKIYHLESLKRENAQKEAAKRAMKDNKKDGRPSLVMLCEEDPEENSDGLGFQMMNHVTSVHGKITNTKVFSVLSRLSIDARSSVRNGLSSVSESRRSLKVEEGLEEGKEPE